jgi:hypothetical protein
MIAPKLVVTATSLRREVACKSKGDCVHVCGYVVVEGRAGGGGGGGRLVENGVSDLKNVLSPLLC